MTPSKKAKNTSGNDSSQDAVETIKDLGSAAADLGSETKEQVTNLTDQVRQQATSQLTAQKEQIVDGLETVSLLLHQAGEHAHQQDKELIANYVDMAAQKIGSFSESIDQQDLNQVLQKTKDFARREPMMFVGSALVAGFLGARFMRSSSEMGEEKSSNGTDNAEYEAEYKTDTSTSDYDLASTASYDGASNATPLDTMTSGEMGLSEDYQLDGSQDDLMGDDIDPMASDLEGLDRPENL